MAIELIDLPDDLLPLAKRLKDDPSAGISNAEALALLSRIDDLVGAVFDDHCWREEHVGID